MDRPDAPPSSPSGCAGPVARPLLQPRFDCRSGELVAGQLYAGSGTSAQSVTLQDILALEDAALRTVFTQMAAWNRGGRRLTLAVNVRLELLCQAEFPLRLGALLLDTRLEPCRLELNIVTHQGELSDAELAALQHLRQSGIRFVTSAASPICAHQAWIRRMPLDGLEVPARLVQDVTADPEGVAIVRALVTRAHNMKLTVNAKGVRTSHVLSVMKACGCDSLQGPQPGEACSLEAFADRLAETPPVSQGLGQTAASGRTLLLVDDEQNIVSSLRRLLRRDGYTILTAASGREGLEVLASNPVDVILSDQRMPGMTGVEFLRKAKDMHPESVRLVLSGYTDLQSVTDAINEGAIYKFLTKPWDDAMLRANIEEAFRRKALSDENLRLSTELQRANRELAHINEQLRGTVAERERRLDLDERALSLAQEALAAMPMPVMGIAPDGMIALSNLAAEQLMADRAPLLGQYAQEILPGEILSLIARGEGHTDLLLDGRSFHVDIRPLAGPTSHRNCLLTFTCCHAHHD